MQRSIISDLIQNLYSAFWEDVLGRMKAVMMNRKKNGKNGENQAIVDRQTSGQIDRQNASVWESLLHWRQRQIIVSYSMLPPGICEQTEIFSFTLKKRQLKKEKRDGRVKRKDATDRENTSRSQCGTP